MLNPRLESKIQKENIRQIKYYSKLLDAAKNGKRIENDFLFIGDIADYMNAFNLIKTKKYKKAYDFILYLDTSPRESFPDNLWQILDELLYVYNNE